MYKDHFPSLFWSNLEVRVSGYFLETISEDYSLNSLYFQSLKNQRMRKQASNTGDCLSETLAELQNNDFTAFPIGSSYWRAEE